MSFLYRDTLGIKLSVLAMRNSLYRRFDGSSLSVHSVQKDNGEEPTIFQGVWPSTWVMHYGEWVEVYLSHFWFYDHDRILESELLKRFVQALGVDWEEFRTQPIDRKTDWMAFRLLPGFIWDGTTGYTGQPSYEDWDFSAAYPPSTGLLTPNKKKISDRLNQLFGDEPTGEPPEEPDLPPPEAPADIEITVVYGGGTKRYIGDHQLTWEATGGEILASGLNESQIRAKLESAPWYYFANSRHKPYTVDTQQFQKYNAGDEDMPKDIVHRPSDKHTPLTLLEVYVPRFDNRDDKDYFYEEDDHYNDEVPNLNLATFALMDNGNTWEPILNPQGENLYNPSQRTISTNSLSASQKNLYCPDEASSIKPGDHYLRCDGEVLEFRYTMKFRFKGCTENSFIVNEMHSWYSHYEQDLSQLPVNAAKEDKIVTSTIDTMPKEALFSMMTMNMIDPLMAGKYYRVKPLKAMKKKDFHRFIASRLTTDSRAKKEKKGWVSKLITAVVIVLAIVAASYGQGWLSSLMYGSLALVAGQLAIALFKLPVRGTELKVIGDIATVVGIASLVGGVSAAWTKATEKLVAQKITEEALKHAAKGTVMSAAQAAVIQATQFNTMAVMQQMVTSFVSGTLNTSMSAVTTKVLKGVDMAISYFGGRDLEAQQRKIEGLREDLRGLKDEAAQELVDKSTLDGSYLVDKDFSDDKTDRLSWVAQHLNNESGNGEKERIEAGKEICSPVAPI